MERGRHGLVTVDTVTSQLLYEIQGPLYFNSDVTAVIDDMVFTQVGPNQVHVGGVKGLPPPPTTKVGVTARGGYQAEFHFYITGLDAAEKAAMMEAQVRTLIGPDDLAKFSLLEFHCAGSPRADADSQDAATVDLRVVAQSAHRELLADDLVGADRATFASYCIENLSQGYPGSTMAIDMRSAVGRPYFEYWACLMPQSFVVETAHLPGGRVVAIPTPPVTQAFPRDQPTAPATADPVADLAAAFGPTTRAPLGYVVLGRSGDKSSNANVGFFVRRDDEWQWLRSLLSVATLRQLLGKDDSGKPIERFELPRLRAVHFLLKDHLDRCVPPSLLSPLSSLLSSLLSNPSVASIRLPASTASARTSASTCARGTSTFPTASWSVDASEEEAGRWVAGTGQRVRRRRRDQPRDVDAMDVPCCHPTKLIQP